MDRPQSTQHTFGPLVSCGCHKSDILRYQNIMRNRSFTIASTAYYSAATGNQLAVHFCIAVVQEEIGKIILLDQLDDPLLLRF